MAKVTLMDPEELEQRLVRALRAILQAHDRPLPRPPKWITQQGVADMTGLSDRTVREATDCGRLPVYRVGRATRYRVEDVERWMATYRPKSASLTNSKQEK